MDHNIFNYESEFENKKNKKLFNENLDNSNEDYETLNLNRMIKYSYIQFFLIYVNMVMMIKMNLRVH